MSTIYKVDNSGIGGTPYLTFYIDDTADRDFTQDDIDENLTACVVSDNNEVGMGAAGNKLFGKVIWVSQDLQEGTSIPQICVVQARGVTRFISGDPLPFINQMVEVDGTGKVRRSSASENIAVGGHLLRGQVIAVNEEDGTCDVWLG